jgi:exodeoxyribonuclease VII large subunit
MILPRKLDLREQVDLLELQLRRSVELAVSSARQTLGGLVKRLADPSRKLRDHQQRLDDLSIDLLRRFQERFRQNKNRLSECAARLHALSPLAVLDRGYAIAHKLPEQQIVKRAEELTVGDRIRITFSQGKSTCRVEKNE